MRIEIALTEEQLKQLAPIRSQVEEKTGGVFAQLALVNHLDRARVGMMEVYFIDGLHAKRLVKVLKDIPPK